LFFMFFDLPANRELGRYTVYTIHYTGLPDSVGAFFSS
jgi:hypothetical protein